MSSQEFSVAQGRLEKSLLSRRNNSADFHDETHVQIAIRSPELILGYHGIKTVH